MTDHPGVPREPHERPPSIAGGFRGDPKTVRQFIDRELADAAFRAEVEQELAAMRAYQEAPPGGELGGLGASPPEGPWRFKWDAVVRENPRREIRGIQSEAEGNAIRDALNTLVRGVSSPSEEPPESA